MQQQKTTKTKVATRMMATTIMKIVQSATDQIAPKTTTLVLKMSFKFLASFSRALVSVSGPSWEAIYKRCPSIGAVSFFVWFLSRKAFCITFMPSETVDKVALF
tara:strand:+ start:331 stop:642 length:312 start_codon:yes stop_codon:yes gene_type:complete